MRSKSVPVSWWSSFAETGLPSLAAMACRRFFSTATRTQIFCILCPWLQQRHLDRRRSLRGWLMAGRPRERTWKLSLEVVSSGVSAANCRARMALSSLWCAEGSPAPSASASFCTFCTSSMIVMVMMRSARWRNLFQPVLGSCFTLINVLRCQFLSRSKLRRQITSTDSVQAHQRQSHEATIDHLTLQKAYEEFGMKLNVKTLHQRGCFPERCPPAMSSPANFGSESLSSTNRA